MFTVKVIKHTDHHQIEKTYSCERYERTLYKGDVHENYNPDEEDSDGPIPRVAETMHHRLNLYSGDKHESIKIPHSVLDRDDKIEIYIMNEQGKTIDSFKGAA